MIERYFRLSEGQTTVRREMLGGLTTFLTMDSIVIVNPQQKAIILRLGKPVGEGEKALLGPGIHWSFPPPPLLDIAGAACTFGA